MEQQIRDMFVHVAAEEPPGEVEPPDGAVDGDGAVGNPVPVRLSHGVYHVLDAPDAAPWGVGRLEAEDRGWFDASVKLELGDLVAASVVGVEADAADVAEEGGDEAVGDAQGGGRRGAEVVVRGLEVADQDEGCTPRQQVAEAGAADEPVAEVGEEAPGPGGDDVGVRVGEVGDGLGSETGLDDGDPRRPHDREGEVGFLLRLDALHLQYGVLILRVVLFLRRL